MLLCVSSPFSKNKRYFKLANWSQGITMIKLVFANLIRITHWLMLGILIPRLGLETQSLWWKSNILTTTYTLGPSIFFTDWEFSTVTPDSIFLNNLLHTYHSSFSSCTILCLFFMLAWVWWVYLLAWVRWLYLLAWVRWVYLLAWVRWVYLLAWVRWVYLLAWVRWVYLLAWVRWVYLLAWVRWVYLLAWVRWIYLLAWVRWVYLLAWIRWLYLLAWIRWVYLLAWIRWVYLLAWIR